VFGFWNRKCKDGKKPLWINVLSRISLFWCSAALQATGLLWAVKGVCVIEREKETVKQWKAHECEWLRERVCVCWFERKCEGRFGRKSAWLDSTEPNDVHDPRAVHEAKLSMSFSELYHSRVHWPLIRLYSQCYASPFCDLHGEPGFHLLHCYLPIILYYCSNYSELVLYSTQSMSNIKLNEWKAKPVSCHTAAWISMLQ